MRAAPCSAPPGLANWLHGQTTRHRSSQAATARTGFCSATHIPPRAGLHRAAFWRGKLLGKGEKKREEVRDGESGMTQTDRVRSVKQARAKHPFPLQLFVIFARELILSPTQLRRERWREREELDRSEVSDAAGHWHRLSRASTPLGGTEAAGAPPSAAARRARLRGRRGSRERVEAGSYATASPSWTARTGWTSRAEGLSIEKCRAAAGELGALACSDAGPSRFDFSVSGRPPAASEGVGPPSLKTKTS